MPIALPVLNSALSLLRKFFRPARNIETRGLTKSHSGGPQYTQLTDGNCQVPQNLAGEVYMMITKSQSVADGEILAGPSVLQPS